MEAQSIATRAMALDSILVLVVSLVQKFTGSIAEEHFAEENSVNQERYGE